MESICWQEDLLHLTFQDEDDFVTIMDTFMEVREPTEVLTLVSLWKEEGNFFFNNGQFGLANDRYERVAIYLTFTLLASSVDFGPCKDLAVALLLNPACTLKLGSFHITMDICSLVINIRPNSKAWFRRAKTALKLGLKTTAFEALSKAVSLDPKNRDIQSELGKVVLIFTSTLKGTRKSSNFDHPKGSRDCLCSPPVSEGFQLKAIKDQQLNDGGLGNFSPVPTIRGGRHVDSPCTWQGTEEPDVGAQPLTCLTADTVIVGKLCEPVQSRLTTL